MGKTLVEELREMVELSIASNQYPTVHADAIIGHLCVSKSDERELFTAIADRIEREYIPRPRFEDGEPVQFGDSVETFGANITHLNEIRFYENRRFKLVGTSSNSTSIDCMGEWSFSQYERLKRPEPEVLDADGVPIHVGDTVYLYGDACEVTEINKYGISGKVLEFKPGYRTDFHNNDPLKFTHKQPDSLERIEADAKKMFSDYWGCGDAECSCCPAMVDGKTPYKRYGTDGCAAAQRLDLLRRQREVLESGQ